MYFKVIRWIKLEADKFLNAHRGIGLNLEEATQAREIHKQFEENAQVQVELEWLFTIVLQVAVQCVNGILIFRRYLLALVRKRCDSKQL